MAKAKKTAKSKKPAKMAKGKKGNRKFTFLFLLVLLLLVAELISYVMKKANEAKVINVQKIQEINGNATSGTGFKAWDMVPYAGGLALTDQTSSRILFLDLQGNQTGEISGKTEGAPPFKEPSGLTVDASGDLFVMDTWNTLIRGFGPDHKPILRIDLSDKRYYGPRGLAWDHNSFLVADTGSHRLARIGEDGTQMGAWGTRGSSKGQFDNPYDVVLDDHGNAFVVDRENDRIQVLDGQGKFVREIALGAQPTAEAIDPAQKTLYVSSQEGRFVKAFSLEGKYIGMVAEAGQKDPSIPDINALCVLPNGDLALLQGGTRILIEHILPPPAQ
ncbi:MAG TPA: NHL repeat-containing protein [bacterium]|nr:NHL repeat-containing protein [bacterium]